jgi:hypothetical protein
MIRSALGRGTPVYRTPFSRFPAFQWPRIQVTEMGQLCVQEKLLVATVIASS